MSPPSANILIVDARGDLLPLLRSQLEGEGHTLTTAGSGLEALQAIRARAPGVVVADQELEGVDGFRLLAELKATSPESCFLLLTATATLESAVAAINGGAFAYLARPVGGHELTDLVLKAVARSQHDHDLREAGHALDQGNRQRKFMEEALQTSLRRLELAYEQVKLNTEELRNEIAQRKRAEEALARSEELRRLQAVQAAREDERKVLAEELHDETMAELAAAATELSILARSAKHAPPALDRDLDQLRKRLRGTEQRLRQIVRGIFPSVLTNLGLASAVRTYIEDLSGHPIDSPSPLEIELRAKGFRDGRLPEDVAINLYRVIQQGITNTIQHAKAKKLVVDLDWGRTELTLCLSDDGVGFDPHAITETPQSGHFGLLNLKDRIEGVRGTFNLETGPAMGTTIRATIPTEARPSTPTDFQSSRFVLANAREVEGA